LRLAFFTIAKEDITKAEIIAEEAVDELLGKKPDAKPTESYRVPRVLFLIATARVAL